MKIWNYVFLMIGLSVVFAITGLVTDSSVLALIGFSIVDGTITFSPSISGFFNAIFSSTGILIGVGSGLVVGFLTKSNPENYIILPFITGTLAVFLGVLTSVVKEGLASGMAWSSYVIVILCAPLVYGYILGLVEFFRGTD